MIVVTGGGGFIGSHLVDALMALGNEVLILDNYSRARKRAIHNPCEALVADLAEEMPELPNVDHIYHLAAVVDGLEDVTHRQLRALKNYAIDARVLSFAARHHVPLTYVSSAMVYRPSEGLLGEADALEPRTVYGHAKLAGELATVRLHVETSTPTTIVRLFNVYGPRDSAVDGARHVVAAYCHGIVYDRPLQIWGSGRAERSFLYVTDAVEGIIEATRSFHVGSPVNVGHPEPVRIRDLAVMVEGLREGPRREFEEIPHRPQGESCMVPNVRRLMQTGWRPTVSLEEGLLRTIREMRRG